MWSLLKTLQRSKEVLGINHRNAVYIRPYNSSRAKRIADDKILSKKILSRNAIPTAEIYKVIRNRKQLETLKWEELPKSFALKPNIGTGGSGILIFYGKCKNSLEWILPDGRKMNVSQLKDHVSQILDGQFSMGNRKDTAIIEERIVNHPLLKPYSYKGIPDIRVIVFNKVPIMAELRLPTYESGGKANLHAGGIGVGIDIATGITTLAIHRRGASAISDIYDIIDTTLDSSKLPLRGIQIPQWREILHMSIRCQEATGLGYLGADIALDREKGPVVLELNARAGLAVQIANMSGMKSRMERVRGLKIKSPDHGIRVARNLFGGEVEDEIEAISGREIIGLVEKVQFHNIMPESVTPDNYQTDTEKKKIPAIPAKVQIDTGIMRSRITSVLAGEIGLRPALEYFKGLDIQKEFDTKEHAQEYLDQHKNEIIAHPLISNAIVIEEEEVVTIRPMVTINLTVSGKTIASEMIVSKRKDLPYPAILGRRDLKPFLLDASKTFSLH
jgi:alpha-L-glutamate ligase-like protein